MAKENIKCAYSKLIEPHKLVPNPRNRNIHTKEQVDHLARLIDHLGQRRSITVSNKSGFIITGHCTLEAIKKLEWDKCAVDYQDFENESEEYARMISDNEIARYAELDIEAVKIDLQEIEVADIDLLGIQDVSLFDLKIEDTPEQQEKDNAIPEIEENIYGVKEGDLWQLGEHRLLCGDCTIKDNVDLLMNSEKADMVFTSPPYNAGGIDKGGISKKSYTFYKDKNIDNKTEVEYQEFLINAIKRILENSNEKVNIFWNINYNTNDRSNYIKNVYKMIKNGLFLVETIAWKKRNALPPGHGLARLWEPIFWFIKDRSNIKNRLRCINTDKIVRNIKQGHDSNFWEINQDILKDVEHFARFPVELVIKAISIGSLINNILFEPFCGSGSTLIACEKTNRKCYGMEIDPHYCSVIIKRWEDFTGKKATKA